MFIIPLLTFLLQFRSSRSIFQYFLGNDLERRCTHYRNGHKRSWEWKGPSQIKKLVYLFIWHKFDQWQCSRQFYCFLQTKCHKYWPDDNVKYGLITVFLHKTQEFADFTIRTFLLKKVHRDRSIELMVSLAGKSAKMYFCREKKNENLLWREKYSAFPASPSPSWSPTSPFNRTPGKEAYGGVN